MNMLQIDEIFTVDYLGDVLNLCLFVLPLVPVNNDTVSFRSSMEGLIKVLRVSINAIRKKPGKYTGSISINGFSVPYVNVKAGKYKDDFTLLVGGNIDIENGVLINQSISFSIVYDVYDNVCDQQASDLNVHNYDTGHHVIRKFHFDFINGETFDDARPLSHLQYGGSFKHHYFNSCQHLDINNLEYRLFSAMDDPRLPNIPYGLVTCLDIIFRSFKSILTDVTKEEKWNEKVASSEKKWFVPFFKSALDNFDSNNPRTLYQIMS